MDRSLSILVVDDFPTMRRIIAELLRDLGHGNVAEADDGETALPMLQNGQFDLLITDWHMPRMPGIELLRAVRLDPHLGDLPVLMVTEEAKRDQILLAAQAGVNDYVVKPFTAQTLRAKIRRIFEHLESAA